MLSREENELLTRIGSGTPMGDMVRRYWLPACLSSEIPKPDGAPVRVRLLGEDLVAFRDSQGRARILEEHCPHRGASLMFARNEECGLRCIYHGWKIDGDGNIADMPVEPEQSDFRRRIRHLAYPAHEQGDVVWAYMGPPDKQPPFPAFEWTTVPQPNRVVIKVRQECNWVQAIEGAIDSSHSSVLHEGEINFLKLRPPRRPSLDTAPRLVAETTPYGFRYGAIRRPIEDPEHLQYVRVTLFCMPFHCFVPPKGYGSMHIFVPSDDEHTFFYGVNFDPEQALDADALREQRGAVMGVDLNPDFSKVRTLANNYLQDREAMEARRSFTGIRGVPAQDMACQESMGPIYDRTKEHLGTSDVAIIRMRHLMLDAVRRFQEGEDPPGLDPAFPYHKLRSDQRIVPVDTPWQAVGSFAGEYAPAAGV